MSKTICIECMREVEIPPLGVMCADCDDNRPKFRIGQWVEYTAPELFKLEAPCYGVVLDLRPYRNSKGHTEWRVIFGHRMGQYDAHEMHFNPAPAAR